MSNKAMSETPSSAPPHHSKTYDKNYKLVVLGKKLIVFISAYCFPIIILQHYVISHIPSSNSNPSPGHTTT